MHLGGGQKRHAGILIDKTAVEPSFRLSTIGPSQHEQLTIADGQHGDHRMQLPMDSSAQTPGNSAMEVNETEPEHA